MPTACGKATPSRTWLRRPRSAAIRYSCGSSITAVGRTWVGSSRIPGIALARLEERLGPDRFTLVTQNVDGLHRRAGSRNVVELHGNLARTRCTGCGRIEDRGFEPLGEWPKCPHCSAMLRPDVVWFEEALPANAWETAAAAAAACDCFLIVGTSAVVYPAAGLIEIARQSDATVIEFNLKRTDASHRVDIHVFGPSGQTLPAVVDRAFS